MTIRTKITGLFVFMTVFPMAFVSYLIFLEVQHIDIQQSFQQLDAAAELYDQRLTDVKNPIDEINQEMAETVSILGKTAVVEVGQRDPQGIATIITENGANKSVAANISETNSLSPMVRALDGQEGAFEDTIDYRGTPVFSATRFVGARNLGVVVKIDRDEVLGIENNAFDEATILVILGALLAGVIAIAVSRNLTRPIIQLRKAINDISLGKLDAALEHIDSKDELGDLARSFERVMVSLKLAMRMTGTKKK